MHGASRKNYKRLLAPIFRLRNCRINEREDFDMSHRVSQSLKLLIAICLSFTFAVRLGFKASAATATSRAQAIATVRAILQKNSSSCRIDRVQSIAAARSGAAWKVTARLVMSASG